MWSSITSLSQAFAAGLVSLLLITHVHAESMTLDEAFKAARARSETVGIRKRELQLATADRLNVRSRILPQASITGFSVVQTELMNTFGGTTPVTIFPRTYSAGAGIVRQPLYRRGYLDARAANDANIDAARAFETRAEEVLMYEVAAAYLAVLNGREQVELATAAVTRSETQLKVSQARYKAGGALKTVMMLAAIEVERTKLRLARAEGALESFAVAFERVVGQRPPDSLAMPTADEVPTVDDCQKKATDRSDARGLRMLAEQSRLLESSARGELWPRLDAEAGVNYFTYVFPLGEDVFTWNARLVLTIPLFQGGTEYARVNQQKIQTSIAELEMSQQQRIINAEVLAASANLTASQKTETIAVDQMKVAQEHYDLLSAQFKMGAVTILELTNAQGVLADAERERALARYESELARYELQAACGIIRP